MNTVKKAIIPVAGLGTRFLPATKAQPKEMLTIVDKPVIQYVVEEAVASGIKDIILITSQTKRAIEDHFDRNFELEYQLKKQKKLRGLKEIKSITNLANFIYIRQKSPRGWGDAILTAKPIIGNEPFAYLAGDDIIDSKTPALKQLIKIFDKYQDGVIGVKQVPKSKTYLYGIIKAKHIENKTHQILDIIEKPKKAPSNLAVTGRYVFTPEIFNALKKAPLDEKGELVGTAGIKILLKKRPFYACEYEGKYFDCGNRLEYLQAQVYFGLKHKKLKKDFSKYLKDLKIK